MVEKLKEKGADEATIKKFQTGATNYYTNHIKPNFKDFDFYTGESMDPDGMWVLSLRLISPVWLFGIFCVYVKEKEKKLIGISHQTGSSSWTTAKTALRHLSPSGNTA